MLNSIDYFQKLEGQFFYTSEVANMSYFVDYHVQLGDTPQTIETVTDNDGNIIYSSYYTGEKRFDFTDIEIMNNLVKNIDESELEFVVTEETVEKIIDKSENYKFDEENIEVVFSDYEERQELDFISIVESTARIQEDNEGIASFYYRDDLTTLPYARQSIFYQECVFGYLSDFSSWEILAIEKFLERDCFIVSGTLSGTYSEKVNTESFKMWVDKETGVMLKLEGYKNSELTERLETTKISVDQIIDQTVFETELYIE